MSNPGRAVRWAAVATSAVYAALLHAAGIKLDGTVKQLLAYLPSLAAVVVVIFDKWLWLLPGINRLHHRPRIGGLWKVEIRPDGESHIPDEGNRGPISAFAVIEQSFWSTCVTQFTAESTSRSAATAYLRRDGSAHQILTYTYMNQPRLEHRSRSPIHGGACNLSLTTGAPRTIPGSYFTDRFTAGEMTLDFIDRSTNYADFAGAQTHCDALGAPD